MRGAALITVLAMAAAISACTPLVYVKPAVTDEVFARDSAQCAEIAQYHAFRDHAVAESRFALARGHLSRRERIHGRDLSSLAELQHRYRRICMLARGYELVPLD